MRSSMRKANGMDSTLAELRGACEANRLVVVAGPAVSTAAGLLSRREVVLALLEQARASGTAASAALGEVVELAERNQLDRALGALEDILNPPGFCAAIERLWYAEDRPIPEIAAVLAALTPKLAAIVSLALDRILPRALGNRWHTFSRVLEDLGQRAGRQPFLLQLHGTLFERETWVLTAQQVEDALMKRPARRAVLRAFLWSHTLLFVGCDAEEIASLLDMVDAPSSANAPRHFALIPEGSPGPWRRERLQNAGVQLVTFADPKGDLRGAAKLLAGIGDLSLPVPSSDADPEPSAGVRVCPFPGLACFDEADAPYFFGRDHDIDDALAKLGGPAGVRWLQIEGASGTGKSSLAHAGILPALRRRGVDEGPETWEAAMMRPGTEPLIALATALRRLVGDGAPPVEQLVQRLERPSGLTTFLREHTSNRERQRRESGEAGARHGVVLVIDQLEEAITLGREEQAHGTSALDATIARALRDADGPLYLITTIRSDQVGRLESGLPQMATLLNTAARYTLRTMRGAALRAAIEAPAKKAGIVWEGDLAARVLADAGDNPGGLPLVAHVLRALFDRRRGAKLTVAQYEKLGGVTGALATSADDVLTPLGSVGKEKARRMLLRLVKIGRGTEDSRQPAPREDVLDAGGGGSYVESVLDRLAGSRDVRRGAPAPVRLIVVGDDDRRRVDLVHEALLREWDTLAGWIEEHRKALEKREDLEHQTQAWIAAGRTDSGLATGAQLAYLRGAESPNAEARNFLGLSERHERRRQTLRAIGLSGASGTALLMGALAWWANAQRVEADRRLQEAIATADYVTLVVDRDLAAVAGAATIRKKLLTKTALLQEALLSRTPDSTDALRSREMTHKKAGDLALSHEDLSLARHEYEQALALAQVLFDANPRDASLHEDLASCHENVGEVLGASGDLKAAREAYERALAIRKSLANAFPEDVTSQRQLTVGYRNAGQVYQASGDLESAREAYERALAITTELAEDKPLDDLLQEDLALEHQHLGSIFKARGDLKGARKSCETTLRIYQMLAEAHPSDGPIQRRLSEAYDSIGEVWMVGGDLDAARAAFGKSLDLLVPLAARDAADTRLQRDLSEIHRRLGGVLLGSGALEEARRAYEKSLDIIRPLAVADRANAQVQHELANAFFGVGHVRKTAGELDAAAAAFRRAREILEPIALAEPLDTRSQRDLALTYERLGDVLLAKRQLPAAREAFERALEIMDELVAGQPSNLEWMFDLSYSLERLGDVFAEAQDFSAARAAFDRSVRLRTEIAAQDSSNAAFQRALSESHGRLGDLSMATGDIQSARVMFERSLAIDAAAAAADPSNSECQLNLGISHMKLFRIAVKMGDRGARERHGSAARAIVRALESDHKMQGYKKYEELKKNVEALMR